MQDDLNELKYFDNLIKIHKTMLDSDGLGVRYNSSLDTKILVNELLESLCKRRFFSTEELVKEFLRVSAIIILYQPFYDGNHRTVLKFMKSFLDNKGFYLDTESIWKNYLQNNHYIPIFHSKDDVLSDEKVKDVLKYVRKK